MCKLKCVKHPLLVASSSNKRKKTKERNTQEKALWAWKPSKALPLWGTVTS